MSTFSSRIIQMEKDLRDLGYNSYSQLLIPYEKRIYEPKKKIAVIGDSLVGKSSFINWMLNMNVIPTGVLPIKSKINISFSEENRVFDGDGNEIPYENIKKTLLEINELNISVKSDDFDKSIILCELPDFISYKKTWDINIISELSGYDAVILVMAAEHLLSESEQIFIRNYVKYIGSNQLVLVVNKLDILPEIEVERVMNYFTGKTEVMCPKVRTIMLNRRENEELLVESERAKEFINDVVINEKTTELLVNYIIEYIIKELKYDEKNIMNSLAIEHEKKIKEQTDLKNQKAIDETNIENAILDFEMGRNRTIDKCDEVLRDSFFKLKEEIFEKLNSSSDPIKWYKEELVKLWNSKVKNIGNHIDNLISDMFNKDITELNQKLQAKINTEDLYSNVKTDSPDIIQTVKNYHKIRRYMPIGMGGSVIFGFCLFDIVGAVVCLTGTSILYGTIIYCDDSQNSMIKEKMNNDFNKISRNTRNLAKKEIEKIYNSCIEECKDLIRDLLENRYIIKEEKEDELESKLEKIKKLISSMEE